MEGAPRSCSDIPLDLAGLVLCRLHARIDRVRFAAVCKQWCSAKQQVPLPPPLPLLALKDGTFYSIPRGELHRFPVCDGDIVTASGNWLVYNRLHCLLLVDPFSGANMTLRAPPTIYPFDGKKLHFTAGCFPRLQFLSIWHAPQLNQVQIEQGAMPNLSELYFGVCDKLKFLPQGIEHLTNLVELYLDDTSEELAERLLRKGEPGECKNDLMNISHIRKVFVCQSKNGIEERIK